MKTTTNKKNDLSSVRHSSGQSYSVRIGNQLLQQLSISRLKEIQEVIDAMLAPKQNSIYCQTVKKEKDQIHFDKIRIRYADHNCFHILYSMDTHDGYLQCTSSRQMRKIALSILTFLNLIEREESDKPEAYSLVYPSASQNEVLFPVDTQTDPSRDNNFLEETPAICQQIHWSEEAVQPKITYRLTVNDQALDLSSILQLLQFRQKLAELLDKNNI